MQNKKVENPVEKELIAWFTKTGMYVFAVVLALLFVSAWLMVGWDMALTPFGVRALTFWQAIGFGLLLGLVIGVVVALGQANEKASPDK